MKSNIKLVFFYIVGFILLYLEPVHIAGLTIGILWKLLLIFILFFPILYQILELKTIELFVLLYIFFAMKSLISYSSLSYPITTLTFFVKSLMFPMLYLYFISRVKSETLLFLAKHFSILIILCFLPYIFGILEPLGEGYPLDSFGLDGSFGLVGPFINPHSASLSLAFSLIIISSNIRKENKFKENLFFIILIILGFYEIMNTYVRTGLVIYMIVLLYLYLREINLKKIFLLFLTALTIGGIGVYLYHTNDIVRMRIEDRNKYNDGGEAGSGRFEFWRHAVENWADDDMSVIFIGLGEEYAKDKMLEDTGLRIFAHNEFFQMLQQEGLIGFSLFLATLFSIISFIFKYKSSIYYTTTISIFMGMIIMMSFQGGFYFNIVFFLSIYLALLKQEYNSILYTRRRIINE